MAGESSSNPITHGGVPYAGRWCRCSVCGTIAQASARFDFYTRPTEPTTAPLVCDRCIRTGRERK